MDLSLHPPETVAEQTARLAAEQSAAQLLQARSDVLHRAASPLRSQALDTTGDLFDASWADVPLWATPTPKVPPQAPPPPPALPPPPPAAMAPAGPARETLSVLVNRKYPRRKDYGFRYQQGVPPGPKKLAQFQECLTLQSTPAMRSQDGADREAIAYVKLFDPCGSWSWYLTEWDGATEAFGLVCGQAHELGYIDLHALAHLPGRAGIGIELDMYWKPRPLRECESE